MTPFSALLASSYVPLPKCDEKVMSSAMHSILDWFVICGAFHSSTFLVMRCAAKLTSLQIFTLPVGDLKVPSPLTITASLVSNVAVPLFVAGITLESSITMVGFDKDGKLFIPQYYDNTIVPPK